LSKLNRKKQETPYPTLQTLRTEVIIKKDIR
jgi:hypothetical protein